MAIYTRTGDAGTTSLFTGKRVSKTHPRVEAYGTLDELNAALSLCACAAADKHHRALLEAIQQQIFWFSAELVPATANDRRRNSATSAAKRFPLWKPLSIGPWPASNRCTALFYPYRCEAASRLHFARTLARRAERRLVELAAEVNVRQVLMRYINRLSDCLYALARAEDSDAHQNNIIREVSRRYLVPPASRAAARRRRPWPSHSTICTSSPAPPLSARSSYRCRW
ncbi:cob(I)yrinic acid a,c-diamide adenosyltransferase [Klebsiella michiganensis]|nr:cob(I)yrinic acid a,c-diamide adenosyltransferase [Klebsiella michiganensis]